MANCRSCGERILWVKTDTGKNMPIDYDPDLEDETEFDYDRMQSHFATCKFADTHRNAQKTN